MPTRSALCLVCAEFVPPSVRHVPYLLPVPGVPCVRALLARLRAFFAERCEYVLLSAVAGGVADRLAIEAAQGGATFARADTASLGEGLATWSRSRSQPRPVMIFGATAIVPNCQLAEAMLAAHVSSTNGDATTVAADVPLGLAPLVMCSSAMPSLAQTAARATTWAELIAAVTSDGAGKTGGTPIRLHRTGDRMRVALETLPAVALLTDEQTRKAAEAALTECPQSYDWTPAQAFKRAAIRAAAAPRPVRAAASPASRAADTRTVLLSSMQIASSGDDAWRQRLRAEARDKAADYSVQRHVGEVQRLYGVLLDDEAVPGDGSDAVRTDAAAASVREHVAVPADARLSRVAPAGSGGRLW